MASLQEFSGLKKQQFTVPAYSLQTVHFDNPYPNYFRVHNQGDDTLYCGTSHQPTQNQYDFAVPGDKLKVYTEPFDRRVLYLFNPSGNPVQVALLSFKAEFDPLALALADLSIDFSGAQIETSSNISGFTSPLPAGTNKIGGVDVVGALPAGTNKIGKVDVEGWKDYTNVLSYIENHLSTLKANQKDYTAALASILAEQDKDAYAAILGEIEGNQKDYTTALQNILAAIGNISVSGGGSGGGGSAVYSAVQAYNGSATTSSTEINDSGVVTIHFLTNDGTGQMTVYFGGIPVFINAGETIQDFTFNGSVSVGSGATFRAMATKAVTG